MDEVSKPASESTTRHRTAKALGAIRDQQLYREDHPTFEAYLSERWGMSRSRAYQQINAAEVNEIVSTIGGQISERGARELADLRDRPDELRETYQQAHDVTGGNVTAAANLGVDVRRAVVGELTDAGMSTRAIAPVVGASLGTINNDQQVFRSEHLNPRLPSPITGRTRVTLRRARRLPTFNSLGCPRDQTGCC